MRLAYQGEPGAYSEAASLVYGGPQVETMPCKTFDDVFEAVVKKRATHGVVPLENSIGGTIHRNYDLLLEHDLMITGEVELDVVHCLQALPGTKIGDAIVEKPGLEQPRYYWDPVIAPSGLVFYKGDLFPKWKTSVLVGGLAGQAIFRLELSKDDKVVNEEPLLTDLGERIRDVRVFQDGAVYVLTDGAGGKLLKLTPK